MGLIITKNNEGLYNIKSSVSDEVIHDNEWISENEAKKTLIEREFLSFLEKSMEIYLDFPNGYTVNDIRISHKKQFHDYFMKLLGNNYEQIFDDFNKVVDELNLCIPKISSI